MPLRYPCRSCNYHRDFYGTIYRYHGPAIRADRLAIQTTRCCDESKVACLLQRWRKYLGPCRKQEWRCPTIRSWNLRPVGFHHLKLQNTGVNERKQNTIFSYPYNLGYWFQRVFHYHWKSIHPRKWNLVSGICPSQMLRPTEAAAKSFRHQPPILRI